MLSYDGTLTDNQAVNVACAVTTRSCYIWTKNSEIKYNPMNKSTGDANFGVLIRDVVSKWVFYFEGNEVSVND